MTLCFLGAKSHPNEKGTAKNKKMTTWTNPDKARFAIGECHVNEKKVLIIVIYSRLSQVSICHNMSSIRWQTPDANQQFVPIPIHDFVIAWPLSGYGSYLMLFIAVSKTYQGLQWCLLLRFLSSSSSISVLSCLPFIRALAHVPAAAWWRIGPGPCICWVGCWDFLQETRDFSIKNKGVCEFSHQESTWMCGIFTNMYSKK